MSFVGFGTLLVWVRGVVFWGRDVACLGWGVVCRVRVIAYSGSGSRFFCGNPISGKVAGEGDFGGIRAVAEAISYILQSADC